MKIDGQVVGRKLALKVNSGGRVTDRTVSFDHIPFLANNLRPFMLQRGLEPDRRYRVSIFDPSTMSLNKVNVTVMGREKITLGGNDLWANRLKLSYRGVGVNIWLGDEGSVLKEESPMGLVLVREERQVAQRQGFDSIIQVRNEWRPPKTHRKNPPSRQGGMAQFSFSAPSAKWKGG
jgi:hypothetical protein